MFLGLWRGVHSKRLPSCLQGRPLHRSIDAACVLKKRGNEKHAYFHKSWERLRGERLNYLSMYLLYIVFLSFSQFFSLATLARLHFILHLEMQACNVFYQPHLGLYYIFFESLSLTDSFQNSLKTRIKLHKIAYKMSQNCMRAWGGPVGWRKGGET